MKKKPKLKFRFGRQYFNHPCIPEETEECQRSGRKRESNKSTTDALESLLGKPKK